MYIKLNTRRRGIRNRHRLAQLPPYRSLGNSMINRPQRQAAQAIVTNYDLPEKRMVGHGGSAREPGLAISDRYRGVLLDTPAQGTRRSRACWPDPAPTVTFDPGFGDSAAGPHAQLPR